MRRTAALTAGVANRLSTGEDDAPSAQSRVLLARQPILDRGEAVCGYELLYRPLPVLAGGFDSEAASANVMVAALADIGLGQLVGSQPAYINVTRELLLELPDLPLPGEQVVLELVEDQAVDAALLGVLCALVDRGFRIALDDFVLAADRVPLLGVASIAKLDVQALSDAALAQQYATLRRHDLLLIAEKVETRAEYERCRALGFDAFQGYYFARPALVESRSTPTQQLDALGLLVQSREMRTFEQLEQLIRQDAGLSHRFLRLANSAYFSARRPVGSIREALTRLGSAAVRRWVQLLLLSGLADHPHQLLTTALQRARLCELLAAAQPAAQPDRAFTVGLLSILDALLDRPLDELLAELPVDEPLMRALLRGTGPEGQLLTAALSYERGDFDAIAGSGVQPASLGAAYLQALTWSDATAAMLP